MPNPAEPSDAGLPNLASYDTTSTPGVVIDKVTHLWWQQPIDVPNNQSKVCFPGCAEAEALAYCANLTLAGHTATHNFQILCAGNLTGRGRTLARCDVAYIVGLEARGQ